MKYPLNKTILIQKGQTELSSINSTGLNYTDYIETYANVYNRSRVIKYDEGEDFVYTMEFTIRYNEDTEPINNKYRVIYNNNPYSIIQAIEVEPKRFITLITERYYGE